MIFFQVQIFARYIRLSFCSCYRSSHSSL